METDTTIKTGDFVRSFDFEDRTTEGERACYVEGEVTGFDHMEGCDRYAIRIVRRVFSGRTIEEPVMGYVYPPVNGTPKLFGEVCNGVEKVLEK